MDNLKNLVDQEIESVSHRLEMLKTVSSLLGVETDTLTKREQKIVDAPNHSHSYYSQKSVFDAILAAMGDGADWTTKEMVAATGKLEGSIAKTLGLLRKQKKIKRVSRGLYRLTGK